MENQVGTFSRRFGYRPHSNSAPVVTEVPSAFRDAFRIEVFQRWTYIEDSRYVNEDKRPIGLKAIGERMYVGLRRDVPQQLSDSWFTFNEVDWLLRNCEWYEFYDCIETVAGSLRRIQEAAAQRYDPIPEQYRWSAFREHVNGLLDEFNIVWTLNDVGKFERRQSTELVEGVEAVTAAIADDFAPAKIHLEKAQSLAKRFPPDADNAIKEAVSAIESMGRILFPKTSTLGDVIKELKNDGFPAMLIPVIERFYAFANAEVRHGNPVPPSMTLADADFWIYVSTALLQYLLSYQHEKQEPQG